MNKYCWLSLILPISLILLSSFNQPMGKIALKLKSETLNKGKKSRVEADIFYKVDEGEVIAHYTYPQEFIRVSNRFGEIKMYFPDNNTVYVNNDKSLSSENDMLYYFFNNKLSDLGLQDYDFKLKDTKMDEGILVSEWLPINEENQEIRKVLLAHENNLPVYIAYYGKKKSIVKKIYYSDYRPISLSVLPCTVVEITYFEKGDSIVNRKQFMDIQSGPNVKDAFFDFSIPDDAKRINDTK